MKIDFSPFNEPNQETGANGIFVVDFKEEVVSKFFNDFNALERNEAIEVIPIFISSYGGECDALTVMYDLIKACKKPVMTVILGKAMSCGAILAASGTKGYRFVSPSSRVMLHEISGGAHGKNADVAITQDEMARLNKVLMGNLSKDMGKDRKWLLDEFHKRKNTDWFVDAKEAVNLGICDYIGVPKLNVTKKVESKTVVIYPPNTR